MNDKIIKAYAATFDANLRIPYMEKKTIINDITVIVSIYKSAKRNEFYCLAVLVTNDEYLFDEGKAYSRYYNADEVMSRDIAQETINQIKQQLIFRKRLLTFVSNNPKMPSILGAAYNKNLIIYYVKDGLLRTTRLKGNQLIINLPSNEQVYLSDLLEEFGIKVSRYEEEIHYGHRLT